jgi:hypothetical protein
MGWRVLLVAVLLLGCSGKTRERPYIAYVTSFTEPTARLDRTICFDPSESRFDSLEERSRFHEIANACSEVATFKGYEVRLLGEPCLRVGIEWAYSEGRRISLGAVTRCETSMYGASVCQTQEKAAVTYAKAHVLSFYDADMKVFEGRAAMASSTPGFSPGTAEVLCRAILTAFPSEMREEAFHVFLNDPVPQ